ncbi:hypothetical protein C8Q76DRAFT_792061 [Earliella scabrosa]|nr:hypothetical protein C8Q76DRAFT_792061 [Earliella scabrosa]
MHEGLAISAEVLSLVPIPGLQQAVKTLLGMWEAFDRIQVSLSLETFKATTDIQNTSKVEDEGLQAQDDMQGDADLDTQDAAELEELVSKSLRSTSDEMACTLQVTLEDLPETFKTIQRVLEEHVEEGEGESASTSSASTTSSSASKRGRRALLELEYLETISHLVRRLLKESQQDVTLPSFTITQYEVEWDESLGLSSDDGCAPALCAERNN